MTTEERIQQLTTECDKLLKETEYVRYSKNKGLSGNSPQRKKRLARFF